MLKTFSPIFTIVNVKRPERGSKSVDSERLMEIKEKFNFEELEVKHGEIRFTKGFPILFCHINDENINLAVVINETQLYYENIVKILTELDVFPCVEENFLTTMKLVGVLQFEEKREIAEFFMNVDDYKTFGEVINSRLYLEFMVDNKKIEIDTLYESPKRSYSAITLNTPIRFKDEDSLKRELETNKKYLIDKKNQFFRARLGK